MLLCCMGLYSFADDCYIPVSIAIDDVEGIQDFKTLENTLRRAFNTYNLTATEGAQFEVVVSPEEIASEVISGIRPTIVVVMNVHLTVANTVTKEQFETTTIRIQGSGKDASRARRAAVQSLKATSRNVVDFARNSRKSIVDYYDGHLDEILNQVQLAMGQRQLERCMWLLSSVPSCIKRYGDVISMSSAVFDRYLTLDCSKKLNNARVAWAASPDVDGAKLAISYLAGIDVESSCNQEAAALLNEIKAAVEEKYARDRERADDIIEFEKEMRRAAIQNEEARIEAMRAIGVAYGENQAANNNIINHLP